MAHFDCLHFKQFAGLINCEVDESGVTCGAIYLAPNLPPALPLFSLDGQQVCVLEIPQEYRSSPTPETITNVEDNLRFSICQTN